jgi:hypothetical protein
MKKFLPLIVFISYGHAFATTTPEQFKILKEKSESGDAQAQLANTAEKNELY